MNTESRGSATCTTCEKPRARAPNEHRVASYLTLKEQESMNLKESGGGPPTPKELKPKNLKEPRGASHEDQHPRNRGRGI